MPAGEGAKSSLMRRAHAGRTLGSIAERNFGQRLAADVVCHEEALGRQANSIKHCEHERAIPCSHR